MKLNCEFNNLGTFHIWPCVYSLLKTVIPNVHDNGVKFFCFSAVLTDYPRYRGMVSELDNWMEWIENSLSDDVAETPTVDDLDDFIGGEWKVS